jgi:hypothetical protein
MLRYFSITCAFWANLIFVHAQDSTKFTVWSQTLDATCHQSDDAVITLTIMEGIAPAVVQWENTTASILGANIIPFAGVPLNLTQLKPGNYRLTVANNAGLDTVLYLTLNAPPRIEYQLNYKAETCFGGDNGLIDLNNVVGGIPPYTLRLNDVVDTDGLWENLRHGNYFIEIEDAIGCLVDEGVVLPSGLEFDFDLGPDITLFSGDTLFGKFMPSPSHTLVQISWTPSNCCVFQLDGTFWVSGLQNETIRVTVYDEEGCAATDDIALTMKIRRDLYAPNVFAPDDALPENKCFSLFANGGIETIEWMQVGDRHGQRWFNKKNIPINDTSQGWDGLSDGRKAPSGVYFWAAKIRYTDGRHETLWGDVTLVR